MAFTFPPKRILAAYDASGPADAALAAAVALAQATGASLEVLHAASPRVSVPYEYDALDAAAARVVELEEERFRAEVTAKARAAAASLPAGRVRLTWSLGFPGELVLELAAARGADLIVCGTHGRSGAKRLLLGSVAEGLVRRSPVPMLCVHEGAAPDGPVLAPYNLWTYADEALRYALALGGAQRRPVTVLYVARPGETQTPAALERAVGLEARLVRTAWPRVSYKVRHGDAVEQIAREAARGYGLVVLSARLKPGLKERALGGVAERLLRSARAAVLALPGEPSRRPRRAAAATRRSSATRRGTWTASPRRAR